MNWRLIIFIYGLATLTSCAIMFLFTFYYAWLGGYRLMITINDYQEALPELIMLATGLPCWVYVIKNAIIRELIAHEAN